MNRPAVALWSLAVMSAIVVGCGGGGDGGSTTPASCNGPCPPKSASLTVADVQKVVAQAAYEGAARGAPATIAVVDRVGNVLAVFEMNGAADSITINGATGPNGSSAAAGGLDGVTLGGEDGVDVPGPAFAAISMAITAAYFSSEGNAFSTRTAGQIIQEHFNPQVNNTPAGPLFGVQFSQITCSDVSRKASDGSVGPKRAPLGFAANPGGLPLYKNGTVVGAIGVMAGTNYTVDRDVSDSIPTDGELIAVAGTYGYAAPEDIRANRITADENFLRFTNSDQTTSNPASAPSFADIGAYGVLVDVPGYGGAVVVAGTTYGSAASGIRADTTSAFGGTGAYVLVDAAGAVRFPPRDSTDDGMTQAEVTQILKSALEVANRARSQIRRPLGLSAQVSAVVVDTNGEILGHVRSPDALVDSADVVVQKARTAAFFSNPVAAGELSELPDAAYVSTGAPIAPSPIAPYVDAAQTLLGSGAFTNGIAYSSRSVGNISAPYFPDGIENKPPGPFSKTLPPWSIFNNGLALDLVYNQLVGALLGDTSANCTGNERIRNGITLFGGGFPIYRGNQLVGGIGVSGDGTLQSDLIGFVGIANAGNVLKSGIGNAPKNIRANTVDLNGTDLNLIYAKCPVAPYLDSTASNVCDDL
jgi:uncharacterized protein GlcG (DUF336 family)